ncbi:MAG TPA: IclR family transcriptional regulator [Syntrophorhabdaceae bacterium]|nr:IclR family transcriptional regulator [Syntrophorhabdaceae bacterium]
MKDKKSEERYIVPAVEQAVILLKLLESSSSTHLSLTQICKMSGINKSKVYSILNTLQRHGIVTRNLAGNGYSLGPALISLSRKVLDNLNLPRLAEPILAELSEKTGGTAVFDLIIQDNVYTVAKAENKQDIGIAIRVGLRFPLTFAAHGKAIAAVMSEDDLRELLKSPRLYFYGKPEYYDKERLYKDLEEYRKKGFALELGEINPGINTIASAVIGPNNKPIGAILVFGTFSAEKACEFGLLVADAARSLSKRLGANP